jgi:signal transduction histidine kinase
MGTNPDKAPVIADLNLLAKSYAKALKEHLGADAGSAMKAAHGVGAEAISLGVETLGLAQIHETALAAALVDCPPNKREATTERAAAFFAEANKVIEDTHAAARSSEAELTQMNLTLDQSALDLEQSQRELRAGITERISAEAALKTSEQHYAQLLKEARRLEEHLREVSRKILAANEDERRRMSVQLQDEIAQTLLSIHVRLNALKKEVAANHAGITDEIATTQRLVEASMLTIQRYAREFGIPHES